MWIPNNNQIINELSAAEEGLFKPQLGNKLGPKVEVCCPLVLPREIAHAFDQIFLISHIHVDERLFTHRVMLENGRVQFTDLPPA